VDDSELCIKPWSFFARCFLEEQHGWPFVWYSWDLLEAVRCKVSPPSVGFGALVRAATIWLLHFYHVSSWSLGALITCWCAFVLSQNKTVYSDGRTVLFGDHTCVAKDGRRIPCVVTMHQHSETQSKPSYFRSHYWGAIGMLIGSLKNPSWIPLALGIH
jgi:hypothetical protein